MTTIPFSIQNLLLLSVTISIVNSSIYEGPQYRWNLVPKKLLKRLCNLDDTLPICAWKRHVPFSGKPVYSKWQICRDHPELNLCKWHNGGMITVSQPATTTTAGVENSAEAPPTSEEESIFVNEPDMILSSKWSNRQVMEATLKKELNQPSANRFEGQLRQSVPLPQQSDSDAKNDENFDESIMTASETIFNV